MRGRKGTGPNGVFGQRLGQKQIAVRIDRGTVDELYRMLKEEGMTLHDFFNLCVDRYVKSDARIRGLIEAWRRDNQLSPKEQKNFSLSKDERREMLREIDSKVGPEDDG